MRGRAGQRGQIDDDVLGRGRGRKRWRRGDEGRKVISCFSCVEDGLGLVRWMMEGVALDEGLEEEIDEKRRKRNRSTIRREEYEEK